MSRARTVTIERQGDTTTIRRVGRTSGEEWVMTKTQCTYHEWDGGGGEFGARPMAECLDALRKAESERWVTEVLPSEDDAT